MRFVDTSVSYRQTALLYNHVSNTTHATPLRSVSRLGGARHAVRDMPKSAQTARDYEGLLEN